MTEFQRRFDEAPDVPKPPRPESIEIQLEGVITDQRLLQWYYSTFKRAEVYPIATDQFLNKSKDQYNAHWLVRELVQNFIDHNPKAPGTLDGVQFHTQKLPNGKTRIIIQGGWKFADPTGVLSPHSDKPAETHSAGGNGIGLKQSAIRFMRDFGVSRFEIRGEEWQVNYRLASRDAINHDMDLEAKKRKMSPVAQVKHDWLVGDFRQTAEKGTNTYVLETDNAEMISALTTFRELGVSSRNSFLKDPDFENEKGAIKWLLPDPREQGAKPGRLFINGQVMHWKKTGTKADGYWGAPEGVTLRLNDVPYKMSVDRPPVSTWDLRSYLIPLLTSMKTSELADQLVRSMPLWAGHTEDAGYSSDRQASFVVLELIVEQLAARKFGTKEFQDIFRDRKFLSTGRAVGKENEKKLVDDGYILCAEFFSKIGMTPAATMLSDADRIKAEKPDAGNIAYKHRELAESVGTKVGAPEYAVAKPDDFAKLINTHLAGKGELSIEGTRITIRSELICSKQLMLHELTSPRKNSPEQMLLYAARGIILVGFKSNMIRYASVSGPEYYQTYLASYDPVTSQQILFAKSSKLPGPAATYIELELEPELFALVAPKLMPGSTGGARGRAVEAVPTLSGVPAKGPDVATTEFRPPVRGEPGFTPVGVSSEHGPSDAGTPETEISGSADGKNLPEGNGTFRIDDPASTDGRTPAEVPIPRELGGSAASPDVGIRIPDAVPVPGEFTGDVPQQRVVDVASSLDVEEAGRLKKLAEAIPGIEKAVRELDKAIPHKTAERQPEKIVADYIKARQSPDYLKTIAAGSGYVDGKHLVEILLTTSAADIPTTNDLRPKTPEEQMRAELTRKLRSLASRAGGDEETTELDIVLQPRETHLTQLGLMRQYIALTTGAAFGNDLFVFRGAKAKGINIAKRAIGLHESVFATSFEEAQAVMIHELAHNQFMDHDYGFMNLMQSLFVSSEKAIVDITQRLIAGESLSDKDRVILDMRRQWEELRTTR